MTSYNVIDIILNKKVMMVNGEQTSISFIKDSFIFGMTKLFRQLTDDQHGYEYSDIVILSLTGEKDSVMRGISEISGIPVTSSKTNTSVMFTTAGKFKGLESRVVIITDIDERCFLNEERKRLFYVACSRATQRLALVIHGDEAKIKLIADAVNSRSQFAARGRIAMKTQSKILDLE